MKATLQKGHVAYVSFDNQGRSGRNTLVFIPEDPKSPVLEILSEGRSLLALSLEGKEREALEALREEELTASKQLLEAMERHGEKPRV